MAKKRVIEIIKDEKEAPAAPKSLNDKQKARKALLELYRDQNPTKFNSKGFNAELESLAKV